MKAIILVMHAPEGLKSDHDGAVRYLGEFPNEVAEKALQVFNQRREEYYALRMKHMENNWGWWQEKNRPTPEDEAAYQRLRVIEWAGECWAMSLQEPLKTGIPDEMAQILRSQERP